MPRADCYDVRFEALAKQRDVAQNVQNLVADKFVLEAKGLFGKDFVALYDYCRIEAAALDFAHF